MNKHNPEVQRTSRQAYELRRQGKRWREIAEITGVRTVYERGNYTIEFRTRSYAKRHKLPWPPQQEGKSA